MIIDVLRDRYSLPLLLERLSLFKSSYYYQETVLRWEYKYRDICKKITELFYEIKGGVWISKDIREKGLEVSAKKRRKYSFYQGKISPSVSNELPRDFHADKPNEKWLTDITEFAILGGTVYLSPILD